MGGITLLISIISALVILLGKKEETRMNKVVISDGFIREYERTSSEQWNLISEHPYSSFCRLCFVYKTGHYLIEGRVEVDLLYKKGSKKFPLFGYNDSSYPYRTAHNISSHGEAYHLARSVSEELRYQLK